MIDETKQCPACGHKYVAFGLGKVHCGTPHCHMYHLPPAHLTAIFEARRHAQGLPS